MTAMRIVLFDGICSLCNASVDFLLRNDTRRRLHFGALQSPEAQAILKQHGVDGTELSSIVFVTPQGIFYKSTAALMIAKELRLPWNILAAPLLAVPRPLRDAIYGAIAKNRYRLWGTRATCRVPSPEERERFLP